ncbi:MAG: thiamine pyrophosphate-dependent enzyme [Dehalococcoidia bacterium]
MAMKPEDVLRAIAEHRDDAVVVPTMTTSPAWRQIAPNDLSVTCVGFMGGASSLGVGIALAQPERRVIVLDGDGSLLMQLGSLATVAGAAPPNFTHILFKNGVYHTSGSQAIPGGAGIDFAGMAKAAGYRATFTFDDLEELRIRLPSVLAAHGPVFVELHTTEADQTPMSAPGGAPFHQQVEALRDKLIGTEPNR